MSEPGLTQEMESKPESCWLTVYARMVAALCKFAMALAAVLILMDLVLIGGAVVLRYFFSTALLGSDEIVASTLATLVMFAAPEVLRNKGHISVDLLITRLPARWLRWASIISALSVLLVAAVLIKNGLKAVALSRMIGLVTEGHLEMPIWVLQLSLPIGGLLLGLVAIELVWRVLTHCERVSQEPGL